MWPWWRWIPGKPRVGLLWGRSPWRRLGFPRKREAQPRGLLGTGVTALCTFSLVLSFSSISPAISSHTWGFRTWGRGVGRHVGPPAIALLHCEDRGLEPDRGWGSVLGSQPRVNGGQDMGPCSSPRSPPLLTHANLYHLISWAAAQSVCLSMDLLVNLSNTGGVRQVVFGISARCQPQWIRSSGCKGTFPADL